MGIRAGQAPGQAAQRRADRQGAGAGRHRQAHPDPRGDHFLLGKAIPDLYLDLSTPGRGAASDEIAGLLEQKGVHNYLIEVAGAVRSKGHNDKGNPWRVAIVEPSDRPGAIEDVVTPNGMAVSTAGSYRNYYELDGKRYSHIIDPATGEPVTHKLVSATVIPHGPGGRCPRHRPHGDGPRAGDGLCQGAQAGGLSHREDRHGLCRQPHPRVCPYLVRKQP